MKRYLIFLVSLVFFGCATTNSINNSKRGVAEVTNNTDETINEGSVACSIRAENNTYRVYQGGAHVRASSSLAEIEKLRNELVDAKACLFQDKLPFCSIKAENNTYRVYQGDAHVRASSSLKEITDLRDQLVKSNACNVEVTLDFCSISAENNTYRIYQGNSHVRASSSLAEIVKLRNDLLFQKHAYSSLKIYLSA